ncbi:MAG TPA: hypothetical protein VKU02_19635 [Gemmataceae bacterium]|nr:hypothetical protein [Gemmataceae bacterium]
MNSATPDVKSLFGRALEIPSLAARAAYLDEACNGNASLRVELDGLLQAVNQVGNFMKGPAPGAAITVDEPPITEGPAR